ncbi:MAG: polysaccharide biosynthesis tyrosine autokinase, partial [Pseudomonadota bacterium]
MSSSDKATHRSIATDMSSGDKELAWIWRSVRRRVGMIIAIVVLACVAVTAYCLNRTKEYTAYAEILIAPEGNEFGNLEEERDYLSDSIGPAEMESEVRLISSAHVIKSVIDELSLDFEGGGAPVMAIVRSWLGAVAAPSNAESHDALDSVRYLKAFRENLTIERDPIAYVVSIGYTSDDRAEAALVANTLAEAYLEDRLQSKKKALEETAENLGRSVEELAGWLKSREREIETFRADADLYAVSGSSPAEQRYNTLAEQLIEAKLNRTDAESRLSQADEAVRQGKALGSIREVQNSPVIAELRGQETEIQRSIADLATRFGENHPIMTNAKAELQDVRQSINREIARVVEQLQLEVTVANNRYNTINDQLERAQAELSGSTTNRIRLKELERDAEAPRRDYETMLERYQRAREQEKLLLDTARIIGPAQIPISPSNISGILLLGFTAIGSCAFGVGLAFLLELMRSGYHNAVELEKDLGHPVLGLVPKVHWTGKSRNERWEVLEAYGLTEAMRSLVYAVLPKADRIGRDSAKILAVTSSFPDEGKSTVALSLARQAAFSGLKTLMIEGDLRKPGMREGMTKIDIDLGLADVLRGKVHYADDAIATEPESGVDIMLGMGPAEDAFTLMRSPRMAQLLQAVSPRYDLIVIDAAPIMAVSETRTLVDLADETLFVVRWKTTERSAARAAMRDLERMDASIAGILLAQIDLGEQ